MWRRALPYLSLGVGVVSALLMDRRETAAPRLVAVLGAGWALGILALATPAWQLRGRRGYAFAERTAVQFCCAQALLFPLPAYVRSAAWSPAQTAFMVLLGACAPVVMVDALFRRVYQRPAALGALLAFAGLVALEYVLPTVAGVSLHRTLLWATGGAALVASVPWLSGGRRWRFAVPVAALAIALLAVELGLAVAVPAVPLRVVNATACERVDGREPVGAAMEFAGAPITCFTAVRAPRLLKDTLVHVWIHDGVEVERIPVSVRGGREEGYRVFTTKANLGAQPSGEWRCELRTESAQLLGVVEFRVL